MKARRVLKWLALVVLLLVVGIQFIRPVRSNPAITPSKTINATMPVSPEVTSIINRSCSDCHTNNTQWPWYTNVAPVSWFVTNHVNEGRRHLNFSEWSNYNQRQAETKLEGICKEVKSGDMPLSSYTLIHRQAPLSGDDVKTLCDWIIAQRSASVAPKN